MFGTGHCGSWDKKGINCTFIALYLPHCCCRWPGWETKGALALLIWVGYLEHTPDRLPASLKVQVQVTLYSSWLYSGPSPFSCCGTYKCFPLSVCHCCLLVPCGSSLVPSLGQLLGESLQQKVLLRVTDSLPLPQAGIFLVQRDLTQNG